MIEKRQITVHANFNANKYDAGIAQTRAGTAPACEPGWKPDKVAGISTQGPEQTGLAMLRYQEAIYEPATDSDKTWFSGELKS